MPPHSINPASRLAIVPLRDVATEPVHWLWLHRLPLGKLVVVDGFPGQGKSTLLLDIAARLSRGLPMPDGTIGPLGEAPADSLILTYEDSASDTLRPRIEAAGGDVARVHHVAGVARPDDDQLLPPSLPDDLDALEHALIANPAIRLLIIDPLSAALGHTVNAYRDQDVRRLLSRLARIAADCNVCVAAVRHLRKQHGGNAITAGAGSIGIIGQMRVALLVDRHPVAADASVLAVIKSNVGPIAASLAFTKRPAIVRADSGAAVETLRLEWTGVVEMTADELLGARVDGVDDGSNAESWLQEALEDGPVERTALLTAARSAGFSPRMMQRASARLSVRRIREGRRLDHRTHWGLAEPTLSTNSTLSTRMDVERVDSMERVGSLADDHGVTSAQVVA